MSLVLHYHPLASFCWKVLIALYENDIAFKPKLVDLGDPGVARRIRRAVADGEDAGARGPGARRASSPRPASSSTISTAIIPRRPAHARAIRSVRARCCSGTGSTTITSRRRCRGSSSTGSAAGRRAGSPSASRRRAPCWRPRSPWSTRHVADKHWATGEDFTLADCAAAPALFYADKVMPLAGAHPHALALLERLKARPSFARVLDEAEPYFQYFPAG